MHPRDPYADSGHTPDPEPLFGQEIFTPWEYRPDAGWTPEFDLVGYHVEATDGSVGKVHSATKATGASHLIVDTGTWIFGRKAVVPAGAVTHIDNTDRRIYLDRGKDEVTSSPDFDPDRMDDAAYLDKIAGHYSAR